MRASNCNASTDSLQEHQENSIQIAICLIQQCASNKKCKDK